MIIPVWTHKFPGTQVQVADDLDPLDRFHARMQIAH
jgi:hypothetical protein